MLFLRVLEGTFVLTIISLCSNANNVGDLKILTPKFVFFLMSCFQREDHYVLYPYFTYMYIMGTPNIMKFKLS